MTELEKVFAYGAAILAISLLYEIARKLAEIAALLRNQQNSN